MNIKTRNLSFKSIITYPNIDIPENRSTFIMGESGSGKSTLLKLLNATHPCETGTILIDDTDINTLEPIALRKKICLIAQSAFLFPGTISTNFETFYAYRNQDVPNRDDIRDFLTLCHLDMEPEANVEFLSGGEKQRVYTAIFVSFASEVLLLDEPTSALDQKTGDAMINNILDHQRSRKKTTVIVSHSASLADRFGDQIIHLDTPEKQENS